MATDKITDTTNIMIDLETMGISQDSMILTIGAIEFNKKGEASNNLFYERINLDTYKPYKSSFGFDQSTIIWWMNQNEEAKHEAFSTIDRKNIKDTILAFDKWVAKINERAVPQIWSHGSIFDVVLLEHHFSVFGIKIPWKYWNVRDTRTLYDIAGVKTNNINSPSSYPPHHALGDCLKQIEAYKLSMQNISIKSSFPKNFKKSLFQNSKVTKINKKVRK